MSYFFTFLSFFPYCARSWVSRDLSLWWVLEGSFTNISYKFGAFSMNISGVIFVNVIQQWVREDICPAVYFIWYRIVWKDNMSHKCGHCTWLVVWFGHSTSVMRPSLIKVEWQKLDSRISVDTPLFVYNLEQWNLWLYSIIMDCYYW